MREREEGNKRKIASKREKIGAWKISWHTYRKRLVSIKQKSLFTVVYISCEYIPNREENRNDSSSLNMAIEVR